MANTLKLLAQTALGTAAAAYTVPAATTSVIKSIIVCNGDAAAQTFSIWAVASGDSRAVKNKIYSAVPLAADESVVLKLDLYLSVGDALHFFGSDSDMGATVSGVEMA